MNPPPRLVLTLRGGQLRDTIADVPIKVWLFDLDVLEKGRRAGELIEVDVNDNRVIVEYGKYLHPSEVQKLRRSQLDFARWQDQVLPRATLPHVFLWDGRSFHDNLPLRPNVRMYVQLDDGMYVDFDTGEAMPERSCRFETRAAAIAAIHEVGDLSVHSAVHAIAGAARSDR